MKAISATESIKNERQINEGVSTATLQPVPRGGVFPLSFAQQRLWFLDQLEANSVFCNMPAEVRLSGRLNKEALQQALGTIVERHESLRTTFATAGDGPVQVITAARSVALPAIDLTNLPTSNREAEARRLATDEMQRPFNLAQGPLMRASLLQLGEENHVLLLNIHQIVSDRWSFGVLFHELTTLYTAFNGGQPSPLQALPLQYVDYAVRQRESLQGEVLEQQLTHWRERLARAPAVLELPTDRSRPAAQSYRVAKRRVTLSQDLRNALERLSQREGVTLFMTLVAAFKTLLLRYSGQPHIVVGTPIAGRTRAETEALIGLFVNTLALSTDLSGDPSFRDLMQRVKAVTLAAHEHQDMPFEKLVEELQPTRSLSQAPLFQVMFALDNEPDHMAEVPGLRLSGLPLDIGKSQFDLSLFISDQPEGLVCVLEHSTDLFDAASATRMLDHFQVLLEGVVADIEQRLSQLPLLSAAERRQLLVEWNQTVAAYQQNQCANHLFEAQAARTPEAVAVSYEGKRLTYAELNRRANQLAHYLRARGVGPEVRVGTLMERSMEAVVGVLGVLKAGGAYVPLDPTYPAERLSFMLEDADVAVLVTQKRLLPSLPSQRAEVVCFDADWDVVAKEDIENCDSGVMQENLAYVIYTSGSTGRPKGVAMPHRALVNLLSWQLRQSALGVGAKTLQFASLSFDVSFQEMFATWCSGGELVLISEEVRRDPTRLLRLLDKEEVERLFLPFVALQQLSEVSESEARVPRGLREVITAGEQLQVTRQVVSLFSRLPECTLDNHYGPSESHVVTAHRLAGTAGDWAVLPAIGRPIANTEIYILDGQMQPVPVGVAGELHIGGACLARGYLNRPELTAERFIPDPFGREPGARLYKTGDLARYRPGGEIEFLGRLDQQVKIRGFRIELGEIEAVMTEHRGVREAAAMVREDVAGDKRLVAYVVGAEEGKPGSSELRRHMKEKLPEYMMPSAFVQLDELPLTPSGKVDRRALPAPEQTRTEPGAAFVAPRDGFEQRLGELWEEVLGVRPVGVTDDFFELGGNSLLAVRLFARIEKVFGKNLPLATLFQAPTVEQLTSIVREQASSESWSSLVVVQAGGALPPFFGVHGALANVLMFRALANHLGRDQPVYGLQAQGLDGQREPHRRVEEMAAHYLKEVRRVQPRGPYYLGGVSFGGIVAFEMAQQLYALGEGVALLALFNSNFPGRPRYTPYPASSHEKVAPYLNAIERHWEELKALKTRDYLLARVKNVRTRIRSRNWQVIANSHADSEIHNGFPTTIIGKIWGACSQAERDYAPRKYPGRVTLFWASEAAIPAHTDTRLGWGEVAGEGLEVHVVPGDHGTMREEPYVEILAEKLTACLQRARGRGDGRGA